MMKYAEPNILASSPSRTMQEVAEHSKLMANQKQLTQKIRELEFRLRSAEGQSATLQAQYDRAVAESAAQTRQLEDQDKKLQRLNQLLDQRDAKIEVLISENEKVVKLIKAGSPTKKLTEGDSHGQRGSERGSSMLKRQGQPNQMSLDQIDRSMMADASLGILAKKRREELEVMTQLTHQQQLKIQDLQSKLQQLIDENAQLQRVIKVNNERGDDLRFVIQNLEQTHQQQLKQQSDSHKQRITRLNQQHQQEIQILRDEIERKKKDLANQVDRKFEESTFPFVQELRDAKVKIEQQQKEITKLKIQQYRTHQGQAEEIQSEFESLQKKNSELNQQLLQKQSKGKKEETNLKQKIIELENLNDRLQKLHEHDIYRIEELTKQVETLPIYKEKSLENIKLQVDNTKLSCEAETQIKKLKDKIGQLNNQLNEKQSQIETLQEQLRQIHFEKDAAIQNIKLECAQDIRTIQEKLKEELKIQQQLFNEAQRPVQEQLRLAATENQKKTQTIQSQQNQIKNMESKLSGMHQSEYSQTCCLIRKICRRLFRRKRLSRIT